MAMATYPSFYPSFYLSCHRHHPCQHRLVFETPAPAFALVFAVEGVTFLVAAALAVRVGRTDGDSLRLPALPSSEFLTVRSGEAT